MDKPVLNYSHDGLRDQLTHCAAPPVFYSHVNRVIAASVRSGTPLTLVAISLPLNSHTEEVLRMAHILNQVMRKDEVCGRLGNLQFVLALTGTLNSAQLMIQRVKKASAQPFNSALVQWRTGESSLELFYRLDIEETASKLEK